MTNPNYTHITVLIDESGSMGSLRQDTIGGFNSFIEEQKLVEGKATLSLYTFSTQRKTLFNMAPIDSVSNLDSKSYYPSGGTALLDAMGSAIVDLGASLAALPAEERPGKVLFIVITDGQENSSTDYRQAQIKQLVEQQENEYKWNFIYLGANVDSFHEGATMGVRSANTLNYDPSATGVKDVYTVLSTSVGSSRLHSRADSSIELYGLSTNVTDAKNIDYADLLKKANPDQS